MAQYGISFSIEGEVQVESMFEIAGKRVRNLRTPMAAIGKMMLSRIAQNYDSHGGLWGRWQRRKQSYPWPLLEQTGRMKGRFDDNVTSDSVTIGNTDSRDIFKYHQSAKPRSSNLPRRVMMAVEEDERRESVNILQEYIMGEQ